MRIGELARRANVGVETVRFYESRGLMPRPARPRNGGVTIQMNLSRESGSFVRRSGSAFRSAK